jgi:hypothetical protein
MQPTNSIQEANYNEFFVDTGKEENTNMQHHEANDKRKCPHQRNCKCKAKITYVPSLLITMRTKILISLKGLQTMQ